MSTFGEIRSLAHGTPSARAWRALCEGVLALPEARREEAIDYLNGALRGWPDALRTRQSGPFTLAGDDSPLLRMMCESRLLVLSPEHARWVGQTEALSQHTTLSLLLDDELPAEALAEALCSPHLSRLKTLRLIHRRLDAPEIEALCQSPALERLERLSIGSLSLTPDALALLARSTLAARLTALELHNPTGWTTLYEGPRVSHPHEADPLLDEPFARHTMPAAPVQYISALDHPNLSNLRALHLTRTALDAGTIEALLRLPFAPTLRALDLRRSHLDEDDARSHHALSHALRDLSALESFKWDGGHSREPRAMPDLLPWARTGRARALSLSETPLLTHNPEGLRALGEALAPGLRDLRLFNGPSAHACVTALLDTGEGWPALEHLGIVYADLQEMTVDWIATTLDAPRLRHLDLYDHHCTTARRDTLTRSQTLPAGLELGLLDQLALQDADAPPLISEPPAPPPRTLRDRLRAWWRRR